MQTSQVPCPSGLFLRIAPGDTLFLIALRIGTTVDELLRLNPGVEPESLPVGELLCLPERVCPSRIFWEVAPGDTLFEIARATGTTVEKLLELNPGVNPLNLQAGQAICLPG
ncbi:MAG: LysM peptidoglycan-binding domain-containing protein [Firmicutes bacterium]|nr:LysM peptidoglycan-binding domain-containing protein [Bacillota bacterium]